MRALIQRVDEASVQVEGNTVGKIQRGFLLLLGIAEDDTGLDLQFLVKKVPAMRVFSDDSGKMNLSLLDIQGEILIISQFTLIADTDKGNRPSFFRAAKPEKAKLFYEQFISHMKNTGLKVQSGIFGAEMKVALVNDGPVTILLDSKE